MFPQVPKVLLELALVPLLVSPPFGLPSPKTRGLTPKTKADPGAFLSGAPGSL